MDRPIVHGGDEEQVGQVLPLPFHVQPHHLQGNRHLRRIQVAEKSKQISSSNIFSPCNSRNLNLNPFCDTANPSLPMWQPDVLASYGAASESRNYIKDIQGPMRPMYPDAMAEKELISSLTEVST